MPEQDPFATNLPEHPAEKAAMRPVRNVAQPPPIRTRSVNIPVDDADPRLDPFGEDYDEALATDYYAKKIAVVSEIGRLADNPAPALDQIPGLKPASAYTTVTRSDEPKNGGNGSHAVTVAMETKPAEPPQDGRKLSDLFVVSKLVITCEVVRSPLMYNKISAKAEVELSALQNDIAPSTVPNVVKWLLREINKQADQGTKDMIAAAKTQAKNNPQ